MMKLGKRQAQVAASYITSGIGFGGAAFCGLLYMTDWRVFVTYIPYYSGKFAGEKVEE